MYPLAVEILPGGDAAFVFVGLTVGVLLFVALLYQAVMPPWRRRELMSTAIFLGVFWLGWTLRTWPSRSKGDGPFWTLLLAWRDSWISLIYLFMKVTGLLQVWDKVWNFVSPFFANLTG